MYEYFEPAYEILILNVTLIKEDNRQSEQIFTVGTTISDPTGAVHTATRKLDYEFSGSVLPFRSLLFYPDEQAIPFSFILFEDSFAEELEAFKVTVLSSYEGLYPSFQPPSPGSTTAFQTTQIHIIDNNGKWDYRINLLNQTLLLSSHRSQIVASTSHVKLQ